MLGHAREQRFIRVLNDGDAPSQLDSRQTQGAIAQHAREHNTNDARAKSSRCTAKQHVDGWARAVLAWSDPHCNCGLMKYQVAIGRRDINVSRFDWHAIFGLHRRQRSGSIEDRRKRARRIGWNMQDHEDRRR